MDLPFEEKIENGFNIRKFSELVDSSELTWHRDKEDRIIICEQKTDWLFQVDNELPITFDKTIFIKKEVYHRLIKGTGDLVLKIQKMD
jgi:hypothetical protein